MRAETEENLENPLSKISSARHPSITVILKLGCFIARATLAATGHNIDVFRVTFLAQTSPEINPSQLYKPKYG